MRHVVRRACSQAMDRCHRIGQKNPVLVFRLATSHSVEVKMLKRAAEKMALERLVIRKDAFKGFGSSSAANAEVSTPQPPPLLLLLLCCSVFRQREFA